MSNRIDPRNRNVKKANMNAPSLQDNSAEEFTGTNVLNMNDVPLTHAQERAIKCKYILFCIPYQLMTNRSLATRGGKGS